MTVATNDEIKTIIRCLSV